MSFGQYMKVLIYVHSPTWFTELSLLGRQIHKTPGHEVLFYIVNFSHWTVGEIAEGLRADHIPCIVESAADPPRDALWKEGGSPIDGLYSIGAKTQLARGTRTWLDRVDPVAAAALRNDNLELTRAIADGRGLIRAHRPDVVLLGGNNPGYNTAGLIEGAHREGVPTVLVPSTMSNGLEEAEVYAGDPRYHVSNPPARLVASLFPHWTIEHKTHRLLRCPPGRALAMELLSLAPPQPWAFNSGFADAIAAESEAMIDYAASAGLPRDAMVLTGSPSDDAMARIRVQAKRLRAELYGDLGLASGRPMLLTALPPNFLYVDGGRPQCDFQDYEAIVKFWIDTLADQDNFNVVVALHPSVKIDTMRHIEAANVRIAARRTSELVPLCDLYVASVSSTIRWAIACGKPVINYDVYRYRYTDFVNLEGVLVIEEQDEFRDTVKRLTSEPGELARLRECQKAAAPRWGFLDGHCSDRILQLLERTVASERIARQ